jgi:glycerol-3-phosphate acyltransferase PlsX
MSQPITIALDAMGGDKGPTATIGGAARALAENPNLKFILFGRTADIEAQLKLYPALQKVSAIHHTDVVVAAHDKPSIALRQGRESSMRKAVEAVQDGRAGCVVSSGNTGAFMAMSKIVLKTLPGIHRPAIASVFPTIHGYPVMMLDLGANVECDAEMLVQFAVLGAVYARTVKGIEQPTVGLLNIGSEEMKGHEELREAARILASIQFPGRFHGFVEGNDIPLGTTDVVVTDGFTGNVAIKVAEGVAKLTGTFIRQAFASSPFAALGALLAAGGMRRLKKRVDPRLYNGGMFLGLNGVCVKSHGGSDDVGVANALLRAADLVATNFNARVAAEMAAVMNQESFLSPVSGEGGL